MSVWALLRQDTIDRVDQPALLAPPKENDSESVWASRLKRIRWSAWELLCLVVWAYWLCQLFFFNVDAVVLNRINPALIPLLPYKFILILAVALVGTMFFWGPTLLGYVLYLAFYPWVVLIWKPAALIVRSKIYQDRVASMVLLNVVLVLFRNTRYNIILLCAGFIASVFTFWFRSPAVLIPSSIVLFVLYVWCVGRVLRTTFDASFFVDTQRKLIGWLSKYTNNPIDKVQSSYPVGTQLTSEDRSKVIHSLLWEVGINQGLHFLAYSIQRYRDSPLGVLFNTVAYLALAIGAMILFTLLNVALWKVDPGQFEITNGPPSLAAMMLYGMSTLVFSEGGHIASNGDLAYILRIAAGFFGPVWGLALFGNLYFTRRSSRDDAGLSEVVRELRIRAKEHEGQFKRAAGCSVEDACVHMAQLKVDQMMAIINWFRNAVPPGFAREAEKVSQ